jgi:Protein of unknown function (DUF3499)
LRITAVSFILAIVRDCSKIGCREPAVATAAMRYREREVWLVELIPERDPNLLDLCEEHAGRITAPRGWTLRQERLKSADAVPIPPGIPVATG